MARLLDLGRGVVRTAGGRGAGAAEPVVSLARGHTTVAVERATMRLAGITGADTAHRAGDVPWVNRVVDTVRDHCGLENGVVLPVFHAMRAHDFATLTELAEATAAGQVQFEIPTGRNATAAARMAKTAVAK